MKREAEEAEKKRQHEEKEAEKLREEAEKLRHHELELAAEAEKVRQHEIELKHHESEMMQAQLELARLGNMKAEGSDTNGPKSGKHAPRVPAYKFSHFNEKLEDLDTFLDSFEKQCEAYGVPEEDRVSHLYSLFSGKYKDTLNYIDAGSTYTQVRDKMLRTYSLTTNGYRERFFGLKPATGETITAFVQRLQACFDKWVSLTGITKDFESLRDLIVTHQISETCNPDLIKFLLEREINDSVSIIEKAHGFFQAHPDKQLAKPTNAYSVNAAKFEDRQNTQFQRGTGRGWTNNRGNRGNYRFAGQRGRGDGNWRGNNTGGRGAHTPSDRGCWYCGEKGHRKFDCPKWREECQKQDPCFTCSEPGHTMEDCWRTKFARATQAKPGNAASVPDISDSMRTPLHADVCNQKTPWRDQHVYPGILIQGKRKKSVTVLRDTGSAVHAVHSNLVSNADYTGTFQQLVTFGGREESFPLAYIEVNTPFIQGKVKACVLQSFPEKFRYYDILIGNGGVLESPVAADPSPQLLQTWRDDNVRPVNPTPCNQVTTRSEAKKEERLRTPLESNCLDFKMSHADLAEMQRKDPSLAHFFHLVGEPPKTYRKGGKVTATSYELRNCVLVRIFSSTEQEQIQIMAPSLLRPRILSLAHDKPFGAHMGNRRTRFRLLLAFYWPGVARDVMNFCKSCAVCQKTRPKGRTPKAPLQDNIVSDKPFHKCAIDLIGPLPVTDRKHRFVLTLIDYATRWVEAVPLKETCTTTVAEELLNIFSRVGLPLVLLSDGGSQFTSEQMEEILRTLGIEHAVSTPYHPQSNGLCERANATIKAMIKKLSFDNPTAWDRLLQCALFAYREVPQETTGFAPFELVYGSIPRGPLTLIRDTWLDQKLTNANQSSFEYVNDLKKKIEHTCELAKARTESQMKKSQKRMEKKSKLRKFQVGDKVLLLLATSNQKFTSEWKGPFTITGIVSEVNYTVDVEGHQKTYHVDMLQEFTPRREELKLKKGTHMANCSADAGMVENISRTCWESAFESCDVHESPVPSAVSVINDIPDPIEPGDSCSFTEIICPVLKQKESVLDITINPNLSSSQKTEIHDLVDSFSDIFSDLPAKTNAMKHTITVSSKEPVKLKPYPLPFSSEQVVREEVNNMLLNDVIEPSDSPYSSPIVLVKKRDGSIRFCIDFRKLNAITIGDACPIPDHDHIMLKMHKAMFFTKLDMTKGYWQIEIAESDRHFTAFQAAGELYQFKRMAFGLKNAPMTFNRLMNRLIGQRTDTSFFFDDVIVFHCDWNLHVQALHEIFSIFRNNNLTVKPSKTEVAFPEIQFLGHIIGKGLLKPNSENIGKILSIQVPKSKKHVRGIIGLVNFYSKFVPNIAHLLSPMHELTKKGQPEKVTWGEECQASLCRIQELISSEPALIVPDINDLFFVQTDASGSGLGCVLLQMRDGSLRPCRFHSRKLFPRETRYAVIEREALAIVWGLQKLSRFLLGTEFVLQTDHAPLTCITGGRTQNARLTRWALILQQFSFRVEYIKGARNNVADYLSRFIHH
ncbi:reverse transcriptase domain-containing protein [Crocosphaera sp.]|uniref:reverse transcriptase domain-containing protein n=1 Tax=Crocosphaera sp. TaxID=2729996 RepID=UPI002579EE4F|nr:reverse transcriptase domain-containing protein [Crocosphaera sp.]NQZ62984.1 DDE-type integrase/transposase/recombinase [Crocosphaera sp.]